MTDKSSPIHPPDGRRRRERKKNNPTYSFIIKKQINKTSSKNKKVEKISISNLQADWICLISPPEIQIDKQKSGLKFCDKLKNSHRTSPFPPTTSKKTFRFPEEERN